MMYCVGCNKNVDFSCALSYCMVSELKEYKMTRQEAIDKVKSVTRFYLHYIDMIDVLEALGLLKFEEEKKTIVVENKIVGWSYEYYDSVDWISKVSLNNPGGLNKIRNIKPLYTIGD